MDFEGSEKCDRIGSFFFTLYFRCGKGKDEKCEVPSFKLARLLPDVVITVISISDGIGKGEECWAEHTWEGNVQPGQFIL